MGKRTIALLLAGSLCLIAALGLTGYNLWDENRASSTAEEGVAALEAVIPQQETEEDSAPAVTVPATPPALMPTIQVDGLNYVGLLEIPLLGRVLPIQATCSDALLKKAPCLYQGSLAEGMIIAGHSYRSHFGSLSRLSPGDPIRFTDLEGNVWNYQVVTTEIIGGHDVEGMEEGDWDLTLFTCTYGGRDRVTIRCSLVTE